MILVYRYRQKSSVIYLPPYTTHQRSMATPLKHEEALPAGLCCELRLWKIKKRGELAASGTAQPASEQARRPVAPFSPLPSTAGEVAYSAMRSLTSKLSSSSSSPYTLQLIVSRFRPGPGSATVSDALATFSFCPGYRRAPCKVEEPQSNWTHESSKNRFMPRKAGQSSL